MLYIKNGVIKDSRKISIEKYIEEEDVYEKTLNPSIEEILADGWVEYNPPTPEPVLPSKEEQYKNRVIELVREKYSIDDELAILRQRDNKIEEFNEYNAFVESVKEIAYNEIYGEAGV